eukprot:Phypoly_transcript_20310.p2 GENE.Phypoly_transcript_20310~~Phypoly_transcript_20310.p2  ORF type:complete len:165 (+),score=39.96 Phypoly_transcript_20310:108-602(+)
MVSEDNHQASTSDVPARADDHEVLDDEDEEFENPYHNPNMGAMINSDDESDVDAEQPTGWVTFTNDAEFGEFEFAPVQTAEALDVPEPVHEDVVPSEDQPDFTTSGFLKKKFTQEHIDLIKECMKNVKLAYVPEWVHRIGPNNPQIAALQREMNGEKAKDLPEK